MNWWQAQTQREPVEEKFHDDFREPCEVCAHYPCVCGRLEDEEYRREQRYWGDRY